MILRVITTCIILLISFTYSAGQDNAISLDSSKIVVSYLVGDSNDVSTVTSAGFVLAGGSKDVDAAMQWMIAKSGGGDVVVIRSSGADGYNKYFFELGSVNSVETLMLNSKASARDSSVAQKIRNAEMLFIAGGNQWNYVNYWKDSPVEEAINYLINIKKVPVGGTSAGLAILGSSYYSAEKESLKTDEALADPYHPNSTLGHNDFLQVPVLANTITDSHYSQRNRMGRHISWMARMINDNGVRVARGIGVDEQTAVCIDENGIARVFGKNNAYFLWNRKAGAETIKPQKVLTWNRKKSSVKGYSITGSATGNGSFDLNNWKVFSGGTKLSYHIENGVLSSK